MNYVDFVSSFWALCSGFRWLPSPLYECDLFAIAKEAYIDFQPSTGILNTIYINENKEESEYNNTI